MEDLGANLDAVTGLHRAGKDQHAPKEGEGEGKRTEAGEVKTPGTMVSPPMEILTSTTGEIDGRRSGVTDIWVTRCICRSEGQKVSSTAVGEEHECSSPG